MGHAPNAPMLPVASDSLVETLIWAACQAVAWLQDSGDVGYPFYGLVGCDGAPGHTG